MIYVIQKRDVILLDPLDDHYMESLQSSALDASFFHSSSWARVLSKAYGFDPVYMGRLDGEGLSGLFAVMDVRSAITGKRGVGLPFSDECPLLCTDRSVGIALLGEMISLGKKLGWRYLEWRGGEGYHSSAFPSMVYASHTIDLTLGERGLLKSFRDSTRRNIKKAQREGIEVQVGRELESLLTFYRLQCLTRKRHGLPSQPWSFFEAFWEEVLEPEKGFLVVGTQGGKPVASAVFVICGKKAHYKYGASSDEALSTRANNLVMWEGIKQCVKRGCTELSLGRTEFSNRGLLQFKRGWGGKESSIPYFRYDLKRDEFLASKAMERNPLNRIFSRLPVSLLKVTGAFLYRHMA